MNFLTFIMLVFASISCFIFFTLAFFLIQNCMISILILVREKRQAKYYKGFEDYNVYLDFSIRTTNEIKKMKLFCNIF